jgi:RNA polymerase sigma factor (sigma-70 family)
VNEFRPAHAIAADAELAIALRAGDEAAVRTLVERFGGLVYTVAYRVLDDAERAEEVAQHTFVQAWRHADSFEPGRDFAPWLATIARRAAIDVLRAERRRPTTPLDTAEAGDDALSVPPPSAEQIEAVWAVRAAVEALDETDREIVRLQYLEGCTQAEIAERLDVPIGTVKSRTHRAHRRLASRLAYLRRDDAGREDAGRDDAEPSPAGERTDGGEHS